MMNIIATRIIAGLEILGGLSGPVFLLWQIIAGGLDFTTGLLVILFLCIYGLSLVAGIGLWRGKRWGRNASIVVQLIQLPKLF